MDTNPQVTKAGILDMQICVPVNWTDEQAVQFANKNNPSGLNAGWHICREGNRFLDGDPERVKGQGRESFVHIMLSC